jgi:acetyl esterase/lipase
MITTRVTYGPHPSEFADVYGFGGTPFGPRQPLVVMYHGGFWKKKWGLDLMAPLAEDLAKAGCIVANVEYPRVGEGLNCAQMRNSVEDSFNVLAEKYPLRDPVVMGHSAGGYYALGLGMPSLRSNTDRMPTKVVALAPVTDLWLGQNVQGLSDEHDAIRNFVDAETDVPGDQTYYDSISPAHHMGSPAEIYLVHGKADVDVPLNHSELFRDNNINSCPKIELHTTTPDGSDFDHYNVIDVAHPVWALQKRLILAM